MYGKRNRNIKKRDMVLLNHLRRKLVLENNIAININS
jgi:hypothetical protein